jgi:hypothetical protein
LDDIRATFAVREYIRKLKFWLINAAKREV